ncbi:hypothetical protein I6F65_14075 [Pseudoalteromonas sp. SWXJZ94C]|uniref:hypothetical protein n=1 Tax=Pseudoalteromonas sp. SWXJZ94C TaxID=2792065 RepID=UPI0018CCFE32|nr:hypothetical protein [Pseudoalteromonas sp. SWXJZ94C]MBH0058087.1 hypothetical protein [Pseudoalteromonas sp. SWXJZ94C]
MEDNDEILAASGNNEVYEERGLLSKELIIWGVISVPVAIFMCSAQREYAYAGFWLSSLSIILASIFGLVGALIGDALRKFAKPDSVFTSGGFFQLIWIKVFWNIGPQVIGLLIGVVIAGALVLK